MKKPSLKIVEQRKETSEDEEEFLRQEILYSSMDKKSDKVNESDLDVSRFAREEENARRRLLEEKDKQMSMASWDIDNYLK